MKNVLILKTPFKGIGDYISDLIETTGHNFCFIEYSRDKTTPYDNYGEFNVYDPNQIDLNTCMDKRSILEEMT